MSETSVSASQGHLMDIAAFSLIATMLYDVHIRKQSTKSRRAPCYLHHACVAVTLLLPCSQPPSPGPLINVCLSRRHGHRCSCRKPNPCPDNHNFGGGFGKASTVQPFSMPK
jgi:hypothetical protein